MTPGFTDDPKIVSDTCKMAVIDTKSDREIALDFVRSGRDCYFQIGLPKQMDAISVTLGCCGKMF